MVKSTRCFSFKTALFDAILHNNDDFWCAHPCKRTAKTTFNFFENINPSANHLFWAQTHKIDMRIAQCWQNHWFWMKNTESIDHFQTQCFYKKNLKRKKSKRLGVPHSKLLFWQFFTTMMIFDTRTYKPAKTTFNFFQNTNPSANHLFYEPKRAKLVYALLQCLQNHWFWMKNTESIWPFSNAMFYKKHTQKTSKRLGVFTQNCICVQSFQKVWFLIYPLNVRPKPLSVFW